MNITLQHNEVLILSGPSSTGKSFLTDNYFKPSQVLSSDFFRSLVNDDDGAIDLTLVSENDKDYKRLETIRMKNYQKVSEDAFTLLKNTLSKRAKNNRLTVIDATSLFLEDIEDYVKISKENHVPVSILFLNIPQKIAFEQDNLREKPRGVSKIKRQYGAMKRLFKQKKKLNTLGIHQILEVNDVNNLTFSIKEASNIIPLENGLDILGDGHGLLSSRINLLEKGDYVQWEDGLYRHPLGRKLVYLNDETSRGALQDSRVIYGEFPSISMMVMMKNHVEANLAYAVDSNHNYKIWRWLEGRDVKMAHGDEVVVEEFTRFEEKYGLDKTNALKKELSVFLKSLPSHLIISEDGINRAVVVHAGIKDEMIGKNSYAIQDFCRFGLTDGFDENGKPIRLDWTKEHQSGELIIWGHEPQRDIKLINNTINIDTGGFCGHYLSMLSYPEMSITQEKVTKSFINDSDNPLLQKDASRFDFPDLSNYLNGFELQTKYGTFKAGGKNIQSVIELSSTRMAPLEEVFYVPPTMSPTPKTSSLEDFLEHPNEAFNYYKEQGVSKVIGEKKHMGSRAYLTLFKNKDIGEKYLNKKVLGSILSRNNVKFFKPEEEEIVLQKLNEDLLPYFEKMDTELLVLDAEILPWNLKAKGLITKQYSLTSNTAIYKRETHLNQLLSYSKNRNIDVEEEITKAKEKLENAQKFHKAFTYYCWDNDVRKLEGIQIAPFHILAFSHALNSDKPHTWHMEQAEELSKLSDLIIPTEYKVIDLNNPAQVSEATNWWLDITQLGHEGIVIKPINFVEKNQQNEMIQPAIKVRGREYLRIIYGMDYLEKDNLVILKKRSASRKMQNALKEFKLSLESIERFIKKESVERIHECVLAALSYENEKLDPRL